MLLKSRRGQVQLPDKPFAKGGEGAVYDVIGDGDSVAKIYHPKGRTSEKERKILAMLAAPPAGAVAKQIAWPTDILYDKSGLFFGFVMPRIRTSKIDALYSYDCREQHEYGFYIQVAQNLCAVMEAVHSSGHICGDLNPANICVDPKTALVTLVDTDSYHIHSADGTWFRCPVCRPEYVPAELHHLMDKGENLRTAKGTTFTAETDYFALAVHIFALLMSGCHPYACTVTSQASVSEFTIISNIKKGIFPFMEEEKQVVPPKYAPSIDALPHKLQSLMALAFWGRKYPSPLQRPTPHMWHDALQELEDNLVVCKINSAHTYWKNALCCPFCLADEEVKKAFGKQRVNPMHHGVNSKKRKFARRKFSFSKGFFGMVIGGLLWLLGQGVFIWLLNLIVITAWWGWILRYLLFGVCAYLPLWIGAFINFLFHFTHTEFGKGMGEALNVSRYLAFGLYGGGVFVFSWGSILNMIMNPLLICFPIILLHRLFPKFTQDLIS